MADDTVERKTLIGFVAAVAVLVLACGAAILSVQGYRQSVKWVTHTYEVIDELDALAAALNSAEAARGEFLATGESSHLEERAVALAKVLEHVQSAKMLTADNAQQQRRLRDLEGYLEGPAARVAEANPRIEALENTERTLLVARHRIDDLWGEGLLTAFLVLLITATAVLTWLCRRIRKEMAERKRQTAALDKANLGLEAANRELESFSYSVSHDLRSPLRAIDGYSQMLEEDYGTQLDDTGRRYIRTVRGGSQRMAALIDDLLTFSRLSRQSLNRQTVDMTALARRAAAEVLEGQPEPKPAVRIAELPPVAGDPALLRQVWTNLIGNAVKYSSKAATPQVQVRAATEGRLVRYEVQDNGVGFDMKYVDKLFGVFQRLHGADEYPGTGVGLATLRALKRANFANHVQWLKDGEEALEFLFSQGQYEDLPQPRPRVMLLDIKMPKIDGIEVLKRLKADARTRSIPVVMLTSSKEETDLVRSYDLGVNSYLVKPVDFKRFSEEVTRVGYYWVAMNQTPGN